MLFQQVAWRSWTRSTNVFLGALLVPMTTIIKQEHVGELARPGPVPLALVPHEVIWATIVSHHEDGVARSVLEHLQGSSAASWLALVLPGAAEVRQRKLDNEIVDVRTVIVDGGWRNWVCVVVDTDERLTGYGECTLEGREHAVVGVVQDFRHHLVGENPENIRRLTRRLGRHGYWESGPVISSGIGGVEMALWDTFAKSLGVSLDGLLGGPVSEQIPVYSNAWYFGAESSDDFADRARKTVALGYRGLKFDPFEVAEFSLSDLALGRCIEQSEAWCATRLVTTFLSWSRATDDLAWSRRSG